MHQSDNNDEVIEQCCAFEALWMSQRSESFDSPYQFQFSSCEKPPFSTFSLVIPSSHVFVTVKMPTFNLL